MKLSMKSFFVIVGLSGAACITLAFLIFILESKKLDHNHLLKYQAMTSTLSQTLIRMETLTDNVMKNALQNLVQIDKERGVLSNEELMLIAKKLQVSDIFIIDKTGVFLRDTNSPTLKDEPNFYTFCSGYRDVIAGSKDLEVTPIILATPKINGSYKFMMMPNHDHTRIIEVGMRLDFIVQILKDAGLSYNELLSVGLYAPSGDVLGEYNVNGVNSEPLKIAMGQVGNERIEINHDSMVIWRKVPAKVKNCCECQVKSLTTNSLSNEYFYLLRTKISRKSLLVSIADMRNTIALLCFGIILLGMFFGRSLSHWLLLRLTEFVGKVKKYLNNEIKAKDVLLEGSDEITFLSKTFSEMLQKLEETTQELIDNEKLKARSEILEQKALIASQVSHDIRSPLAALNMIMDAIQDLPEDKRIIARSATQRINDIANTLLQKGKNKESFQNTHMLSSLLDSIVSEKRMQFREYIDVLIESNLSTSYGIFIDGDYVELKRLFSNLINNSVEAFENKKGQILVSVKDLNDKVLIELKDSGKGIPATILSQLGERGVSFGKNGSDSGSGLGLFHAKNLVEKMGGKFEIQSEVNIGTSINILLPKVKSPNWFIERLNFAGINQIIVLDDDQSIHNIWKNRIKSFTTINTHIELVHFTSGEGFKEWYYDNSEKVSTRLYLFDFELLNQKQTGLDIAEELNLSEKVILVTSRYDNIQILNRCSQLRIKLIPKPMASLVPIC